MKSKTFTESITFNKKLEKHKIDSVYKRTTSSANFHGNTQKNKRREGESQRIWREMYKVLDSSDVIIEVLDARDPNGTRCTFLERHVRENSPHKHLIVLLNKCDLVPHWVTKTWLNIFSKQFPSIAFHASVTKPFGKSTLLSVLHQISEIRSNKSILCVGLFGYPNVGKSSIINTLRNMNVCKSTSVPGETKVWQFVTMMKKMYLIDSPGAICHDNQDSETDLILKGVKRVENVKNPTFYIPEVIRRVDLYCLQKIYQLPSWTTEENLLDELAYKRGRSKKHISSNLESAAKIILYDWQRGKIPFFKLP